MGKRSATPARHETVARNPADLGGGSEPGRRVRSRRDSDPANRTANRAQTATRAG